MKVGLMKKLIVSLMIMSAFACSHKAAPQSLKVGDCLGSDDYPGIGAKILMIGQLPNGEPGQLVGMYVSGQLATIQVMSGEPTAELKHVDPARCGAAPKESEKQSK